MFYQFPFWVGKKFQVNNQRRYLTVSIHHTWEVLKAFGDYLVRVKFFLEMEVSILLLVVSKLG